MCIPQFNTKYDDCSDSSTAPPFIGEMKIHPCIIHHRGRVLHTPLLYKWMISLVNMIKVHCKVKYIAPVRCSNAMKENVL